MAPILGKRKRRDQIDSQISHVDPHQDDATDEQLQALFRQHFEAKFKPLKTLTPNPLRNPQPELINLEHSEDSDWTGLSDDNENDAQVQIIEHKASIGAKRTEVPLEELKSFMTTKPPTSTSASASAHPPSSRLNPPRQPSPTSDAANLKKDLALQRLLQESHLLIASPTTTNTTSSTPTPKSSQSQHAQTLSHRLQTLLPSHKPLPQQKMPLSHRRGIVSKSIEKEERRRREAKENGIVLEKVGGKGKGQVGMKSGGGGGGGGKRERGIGGPTVGKFEGGTLKLSKKDVAEIEGGRGRGGSRGRGRGRGGKR